MRCKCKRGEHQLPKRNSGFKEISPDSLPPFSSLICCLGCEQGKAGASADVCCSHLPKLGHPSPATALSWLMSQCWCDRLMAQPCTCDVCRAYRSHIQAAGWFAGKHSSVWFPQCLRSMAQPMLATSSVAVWGAPLPCSGSTPAFVWAASSCTFILTETDLEVTFMQMNKMRKERVVLQGRVCCSQ